MAYDGFDLIGLLNNKSPVTRRIRIPYYTSTTINKNASLYMEYTDIIFPIIMNIEIPKGSHVLCLGTDPITYAMYGLPGQAEVLLKRNYQLEYQNHSWRDIPYYDGRGLIKGTYGLIINFRYIE